MTGIGKGIFNIFVGTLLFLNEDDGLATLMGWAMIGSGIAFIFLLDVVLILLVFIAKKKDLFWAKSHVLENRLDLLFHKIVSLEFYDQQDIGV